MHNGKPIINGEIRNSISLQGERGESFMIILASKPRMIGKNAATRTQRNVGSANELSFDGADTGSLFLLEAGVFFLNNNNNGINNSVIIVMIAVLSFLSVANSAYPLRL